MTTRNLLLAGTIVAGPLLLLAIPGSSVRADTGPALRLAQAEPGGPGERGERGGPQREERREGPQQRGAPPPREAPRAAPPPAPPREAPAPRAEPPHAEPPRAEPPPRAAEPPRERPQAPPPAPERREPPQAAPERREPPRAEPPRERPQTPPGLERREPPPAPRAEPPRAEPPRAEPPREQPRTPAPPPAPTPTERTGPRPETAPAQRPVAPAVPPSATQPRPDLGVRPEATPQQRPSAPTTPPAPPPAPRSTAPNAPGAPGIPPQAPNLAPQGLAPPQPRDGLRPADRPQDRGGQIGGQPGGQVGGQPNDRARVEQRDGRTYIRENDNRLIIREGDRDIIRHDEIERLRRGARDVDVQQRPNGRREIVIVRPDGDRIVSIVDEDGNLLRRERRARDGRTYVLIENDFDRPRGGFYRPVELPPFRLDIPRDRYIVEAEDAPYEVIERTLTAPPVERVERAYSLDEVRYNQRLREKMSRVDVDTINFEFGSADIDPNGAARLESIARALLDAIRRNPNEVFLIEGHTDAVGSDTDNLALSDRRAEAVAAILTERYQVPPENLVTQGYGEQFLKVQTQAPERQNRRVTVRRITPLLQQGQNQAPPPR